MECPYGNERPNLSGKIISVKEKKWFVYAVTNNIYKVKDLSNMYGLTTKTIYKMIRQDKVNSLSGRNGRSCIIDDEEGSKFYDEVTAKNQNNDTIKYTDTKKLLLDYARATAVKKNKTCVSNICTNTRTRFFTKLNINIKKAQSKTDARMKAEQDARNCISTIIMYSTITNFVKNPYLYINYDATQFSIVSKDDELVKCIIPSGVRNNNEPTSTSKAKKSQDLDFAIKWFCIMTAGGCICNRLVFLISDSGMEKEDFNYFRVDELSVDCASNERYGYVCFTKTRCGNQAFFHWLNSDVLIPYIKLLKEKHGTPDCYTFLCCDGENCQISPYTDIECPIKQQYDDMNVLVTKLAASTTAITQPADAYFLFKSLKKTLCGVADSEINQYTTLNENIRSMINAQQNNTGRKLSTSDGRRISSGLIKIIITFQKSLNVKLIRKSFNEVGLETLESTPTVNYCQILKNFKVIINNNEFLNMMNMLGDYQKKFMRDGIISDMSLKKFDFIFKKYSNNNGGDKDKIDAPLSRTRCAILNNVNLLKKINDKKEFEKDKDRCKIELKAMRLEDKKIKYIPKNKTNTKKRASSNDNSNDNSDISDKNGKNSSNNDENSNNNDNIDNNDANNNNTNKKSKKVKKNGI